MNAPVEPIDLEIDYQGPESAENDAEPAEPTTAIDRAWKPLDPDLLLRQPGARRWLLRHPTRDGHPCASSAGDGLLPLGKAATLIADGGIGKTGALLALGVCIVTGRRWFGHFEVDERARNGRVLLALAEEDLEEVHRRLFTIANALELDRDERLLVASRIVVLPLAGVPVALVTFGGDGRTRIDSPELAALRRRLAADAGDHGWSLIVLDPLARWGDDDAEKDNAAATRLIQAAESLVNVPGNPTVLIAHHASAEGVKLGAPTSRGVTGIKNGARWEATLRAERGDVFFRQTKSNYSRPMVDEIRLVRGADGVLRVPTSTEEEAREEATKSKQGEREQAKEERRAAKLAGNVKAIVDKAGAAPLSVRQLAALAGGMRPEDAQAAVHRAVALKLLVAGHPLRGHDRFTLVKAGQ